MVCVKCQCKCTGEGESAWLHPGSAEFDFRSTCPSFPEHIYIYFKTHAFLFIGDVQTTPTAEMLEAITHASLGNDVSYDDESTAALQNYVAEITSHEDALFVLSGTMGNLLAIRSLLTQPPYGVLSDARSHFLTTEAGGTFSFTGAVAQPVEASNGQYLTLEDILPRVKINPGKNVHMVPTRVIVLENTLRGMVMPLNETQRICEFAHKNDIKVHLDGARLWEAVVHCSREPSVYLRTLKQYCSLFDTVTMCFTKGLGAPVGSILVGSKAVIRQARWLRQSIGGGVRQPGPLAACAYTALKKTFEDGLLERPQEMAMDISAFWEEKCGGRLLHITETNMLWLDLSNQQFTLEDLRTKAQERGLHISRERLVIHYRKYYVQLRRTIQHLEDKF